MLYRKEEEPETTTKETQTETTDEWAESFESFEMVTRREEVIPTVQLHPAPTPSPQRKPPHQPLATSTMIMNTTTMPVTSLPQPESLERLTTHDRRALA